MVELFTRITGRHLKIDVRLMHGFRGWAVLTGVEDDLQEIGFGNVVFTDQPEEDEIFEARVGVVKVEKQGPDSKAPIADGVRYARVVAPLAHRELRRDKRFPVTWPVILEYTETKVHTKTVNISVGGAMVRVDRASREDALNYVREGDRVKTRLAMDRKGNSGWIETEADLLDVNGDMVRLRFIVDTAVEAKLVRVLIFNRSAKSGR